MKRLLTLVVVVLSIFLIYLGFRDRKIYYLSIGDGLAAGMNPYNSQDYGYANYVKDYLEENNKLEKYVFELANSNKRATDIINEINDNIEVNVNGKNRTFQNVLIKADVVTVSLGMNDIFANLQINNDFSVNDLYNKLEQVINDFDILFKLLREYCKEKIIYIGLYNTTNDDQINEFINYTNKEMEILASKYDIEFVPISEEFSDQKYFPNMNSKYPNKEGYKIIADKIIDIISNKVLKK